MARIRLVTDSTADLPREVREEFGIEMVPLKVHFGEETYLDSVTLQQDEFYPKLQAATALPTTSQPSPIDFLDVYKRLLEEDPDTHILSIHISAALSGTYQSASLAKSLLEDPERVTVIDSKSASYGIGMLVVAAAEAIAQGKSLEEIVRLVHAMRQETTVYFIVDTLEFLQKGGRIGKAQALLGSLLNIKPILTIDIDGEVASVDKTRGTKKAVQRMIELFREKYDGQMPVRLWLVHSNDPERAEEVRKSVEEHFTVQGVVSSTIGPVIGTHAGPGTIGMFIGPA